MQPKVRNLAVLITGFFFTQGANSDVSHCNFGSFKVDLEITTSQNVTLKPYGVNPITAIDSGEKNSGSYAWVPPISSDSSCDRTQTFRMPKGTAAVLLKHQAKQDALTSLAVIVWHAETGKVITVKKNLGSFLDLAAWERGFQFSQPMTPFEPKPTKVELLKEEREVLEEQLKTWHVVTLKSGAVFDYFSRKQTYEAFPYRKYFNGQPQFEKAFGFNPKLGKYAKRWLYLAKSSDEKQPDCVQPSENRKFKIEEKYWYCESTSE